MWCCINGTSCSLSPSMRLHFSFMASTCGVMSLYSLLPPILSHLTCLLGFLLVCFPGKLGRKNHFRRTDPFKLMGYMGLTFRRDFYFFSSLITWHLPQVNKLVDSFNSITNFFSSKKLLIQF